MKQRCGNTRHPTYSLYGGRGVTVCNEWLSDFQSFARWAVAQGHRKGLQLDRRDNDGNYTPENCRLVTPRVNSSNKRNSNKLVGVYWHKHSKRWFSQIRYLGKRHSLGYYKDINIAAFAYEFALAGISEI